MISELRETIYDVLYAVDGLSSVFYKEAEQGTAPPYAVFFEVTADYDRLDTTDKIENVKVQIDLYGAKYDEASHESLLELVKTALDTESNYSLSSYTIMDVLRDFAIPIVQEDIIQTSLQYTFNLIEA